MSSEPKYPAWVGAIVNEYVTVACQRAAGDPAYDADRHARASLAFDDMLHQLTSQIQTERTPAP